MTISLESVPAPNTDFKLEDMDGEILLYHVSSTHTLHLNSSAAIIWQLCDGERNVGEIIEAIRESYEDSGEELETDVISALNDLVSNQVLTAG